MESYPIPKFLRDSMRETAEKQAACKHENRECTYESDDGLERTADKEEA